MSTNDLKILTVQFSVGDLLFANKPRAFFPKNTNDVTREQEEPVIFYKFTLTSSRRAKRDGKMQHSVDWLQKGLRYDP